MVDDQAESVLFQALLTGNLASQFHHFRNQFRGGLEQGGNPLFWNDENMHGRLWVLVADGEGILRLGNVALGGNVLERTWLGIELAQFPGGDLCRGGGGREREAERYQDSHCCPWGG